MRIEIFRNRMKDPKMFEILIKTFEYFGSLNNEREDILVKTKDKEGIIKLLFELINYIEPAIKKKFSENFNIIISDNGTYAMKFDPKYFLGLKYSNYDILLYKTPHICVPSQFSKKKLKESETLDVQNAIIDLKNGNIARCLKLNNFITKEEKITSDFIIENIIENIAFHSVIHAEQKDLSILCQLIQYDLALKTDNYNWCVIISKNILASQAFLNSSNVVYQVKFYDPENKFIISQKLNECEILIYKKVAIFESVLKNILTGRLYEVELKHIVVLFSLIIFISLIALCKSDYSDPDIKLNWFEDNVCKNKRSVFGGIGLMFIFAIIFGFLKAKMNKKKVEKKKNFA